MVTSLSVEQTEEVEELIEAEIENLGSHERVQRRRIVRLVNNVEREMWLESQNILPEDTYSLLAVVPMKSWSTLVSVLVLFIQYATLSLLMWDILSGHDEDNPMGIPKYTAAPVRGSQLLAIIISVVSQLDVTLSIGVFVKGYGAFTNGLALDEAEELRQKRLRWVLPNILRLIEGAICLVVTFLLIFRSRTVRDLLLNFTAAEFISNIDNGTFLLAKWGYFGDGVRENAKKRIIGQNGFVQGRGLVLSTVLLLIMFGLLGGWAYISTQQCRGAYLPKSVYVQFGDDENYALSYASGFYDLRLRKTRAPIFASPKNVRYEARAPILSGEDPYLHIDPTSASTGVGFTSSLTMDPTYKPTVKPPGTALGPTRASPAPLTVSKMWFQFCGASWNFGPGKSVDLCKEWLVKSSDPLSFDISTSDKLQWFATSGEGSMLMDQIRILPVDDIEEGCSVERYKPGCVLSPPCESLTVAADWFSLYGGIDPQDSPTFNAYSMYTLHDTVEDYNDTLITFNAYSIFDLVKGEKDTLVTVNERPVYSLVYSLDGEHKEHCSIVMFSGLRWVLFNIDDIVWDMDIEFSETRNFSSCDFLFDHLLEDPLKHIEAMFKSYERCPCPNNWQNAQAPHKGCICDQPFLEAISSVSIFSEPVVVGTLIDNGSPAGLRWYDSQQMSNSNFVFKCGCKICPGGGEMKYPLAEVKGHLECASGLFKKAYGTSGGSFVCFHYQKGSIYQCGCPYAPPKNPSCFLCTDGPMSEQVASIIPFENGATEILGSKSCGEIEWDHAHREGRGCTLYQTTVGYACGCPEQIRPICDVKCPSKHEFSFTRKVRFNQLWETLFNATEPLWLEGWSIEGRHAYCGEIVWIMNFFNSSACTGLYRQELARTCCMEQP